MSEDTDDPERSYRRGYTHGGWDVMQALSALILPGEFQKLESWFHGPARQWRMEAYTGKSRRGPGGMITADLVSPRHSLR